MWGMWFVGYVVNKNNVVCGLCGNKNNVGYVVCAVVVNKNNNVCDE